MPQNADPMEDQFAKKADLRSEKVAKNEIQRMRNIVKAKKGAIPRTGFLGSETAKSTDVRMHSSLKFAKRIRLVLIGFFSKTFSS